MMHAGAGAMRCIMHGLESCGSGMGADLLDVLFKVSLGRGQERRVRCQGTLGLIRIMVLIRTSPRNGGVP